jgi:hypothetical protein
MVEKNYEKLIHSIKTAIQELESKTEEIDLYSGYQSYQQFADHLKNQLIKIKNHDSTAFQELYEIFLPTSDWDDSNGSEAIANEILCLLKNFL